MKKMEQTRREFLRSAGKAMLGAAALTAVPAVLTTAKADDIAAPAWPWTWHHLDAEKVKAKVVENFSKNGGCGAAVCSGIMDLLAEEYGYPYNQVPVRLMAHAGGGYGNRNLCGSLGGAFAILGFFLENPGTVRKALYDFYTSTEFPVYQPADKPVHPVHSVSASELCRDSVGKWMELSGFEFGSPERATRCACLSADVAAKTCELLDEFYGLTAAPSPEAEEIPLADNEYIGVAQGFGGEIKVKVTMDGDKIAKIEVLSHGETAGICEKAFDSLPAAIIANNGTAGIDTVSGATYTSKGLIEAVNNALAQVK